MDHALLHAYITVINRIAAARGTFWIQAAALREELLMADATMEPRLRGIHRQAHEPFERYLRQEVELALR